MKTKKDKKVFAESLKTEVFFRRKLGEDQKKKVFAETEVFFVLNHYSRGIW